MRFGLIYEQQLPRPWTERSEADLFQQSLDQIELADRLGYDYAWANEHHFLEEYAHSSAPEVFLAAAARNTKQIRLGHAVVLTIPGYNHPARIAERIATLDIISNGRVEFGTGESSSAAELEGFNIDIPHKREMWSECVEQVANMMTMTPYPGFQGEFFSMPCRNVVPKPLQGPHPPLWLACSNRDSILRAARMGMGALTFSFVSYEEAKTWVEDYYAVLKSECVPIGHSVNANIAVVSPFSIHEDYDEAVRRGLDSFRFFGFCAGHHYGYGEHTPGRTDIWSRFEKALPTLPNKAETKGIGTPAQLREHVRTLRDIGVDQVIFLQQSGRIQDSHVREGLQLFADTVMPEFKVEAGARERRKADELAPYIEAAMARKVRMAPLADEDIPTIQALGKRFAATSGNVQSEDEAMKAAAQILMEESAERIRWQSEKNAALRKATGLPS